MNSPLPSAQLNQIIEFVNQGWVSLLLGSVITIALTLAFLRVRRPVYSFDISTVISKASTGHSGLEVKYNGEVISNLQRLHLLFWNAGRRSIRRSDIPNSDSIRFEISDVRILSANIIASTRPSLEPTVEVAGQVLLLGFDNLDHRDGFYVEIFCEGSVGNVSSFGKILESKPIGERSLFPFNVKETRDDYRIAFDTDNGPSGFIGIPLVTVFLLLGLNALKPMVSGTWWELLIWFASLIVFLVGTYFFVSLPFRKLKLPRTLKKSQN